MLGIILLISIFVLVFIILHKVNFKYKNILKIIFIVLAVEVFIFNFNSFRLSLKNYEKKIYNEPQEITIKKDEDNEQFIELNGINTEIGTVKLDAVVIGEQKAEYNISYTDETSSNYRELPSKVLVNGLARSKYTICYLSGKSNKIKINFEIPKDVKIQINSITINESVPFNFSISRVLTILIATLLIYGMFRSEIFKNPYTRKNKWQFLILLAITLGFIITIWWIAKDMKFESSIYEQFVNALSKGQISFEKEPPQSLINLDNPYDTTQRDEKGVIWDAAYYNGKYYSYFGILPFLLLPVPYKIVTNAYLGMNVGVMIFSIISIISLSKLMVLLYRRWFKNLSFSYLVLAIIGVLSGSLIFWINRRPDVYEFAVSSAVCFSTLGICLMFKAIEEQNVKYKYLCFSSISLALAVACRPNHLLVSLILLPKLVQIFIENIKQKKDIAKLILSVGMPYLIVGILLMYYNYIRFGSIFEFGTNYQLTVNDIGKLQNRIMTIPTGIITQLFKLPITTNEFPFFTHVNDTITFFGYYYIESHVCGLFILNPINFILLLLIGLKKKIKEKQAYNYTCIFTIVAFIICILNIIMAGTLQRYSIDYAWILNIASYLTLFLIISNINSKEIKKYILKFSIIITLFTLFANFIVGGVVSENNLLERKVPKDYYNIRYDICFWE